MFSAKINRLEGSEREDLPRRERECGFDRRNNLDRPLSFQFFSLHRWWSDHFFSEDFPHVIKRAMLLSACSKELEKLFAICIIGAIHASNVHCHVF